MGEKDKQWSGDNGGEDPPVPISNTEVKLPSAEDTWREAARENRTLPVWVKSQFRKELGFLAFLKEKRLKRDSEGSKATNQEYEKSFATVGANRIFTIRFIIG